MKKLFENPEISLFELTSEDVVMVSANVGSSLLGKNLTAVTLTDEADKWKGTDAWIDE